VKELCFGIALFGCAVMSHAADNERFTTYAAIEAQDSTFASVAGDDFDQNPAAFGDPPLPGGASASYGSTGSSADGTFGGNASGIVDTAVPAGSPPILRAEADGTLDLTSVGKNIFAYRVTGSAAWEFDITATGPGGSVYMVPIFNIDGTLTGTGASIEGGAALSYNVIGESFGNLVDFPVPTDGSISIINTTTPAMGIPLATGSTEHIVFDLAVTLDLVPFAGIVTPYSASADGDFSSSAQLIGLQFFADPELTDDISGSVSVTGGGATNLQSLVVPEPTSMLLLAGGAAALLRRRTAR